MNQSAKQFFKSTPGVLTIAGVVFILLVSLLSMTIYLLSAGKEPIKTDADMPVIAFWEVMKFALDPEKMRHISRAEGAFFRAEAAARKHQYQIAHDNFEEANHEIFLGAGDQSVVAATFLQSQAAFENDNGKYALAAKLCRKVLTILPFCNDRILLLRCRQQLARALVYGSKAEKNEACALCESSIAVAQAVDKNTGVVGYNSETASVYEWLGYCQQMAGQIDAASTTYKKTITIFALSGPEAKGAEVGKKISGIYIKLAEAELGRKKISAAIGYYDTAIAKDPRNVRLYHLRSTARLENHDYDGAIADVMFADNVKHNTVATTENLLSIYQARGDAKAALAAVDRAIGKDKSDDAYLYALRGFVYASSKQLGKAIADLNKCVELDPEEPIYRRYRACVYANAGQYKQAVEQLCDAIKNSDANSDANNSNNAKPKPNLLQTHYLRAAAYASLHDYKAAIKDLDFILANMHPYGFSVEGVDGFQVQYKFFDRAKLLRMRGGYYELDNQPLKAESDKKAADEAVKVAKGEPLEPDEDED